MDLGFEDDAGKLYKLGKLILMGLIKSRDCPSVQYTPQRDYPSMQYTPQRDCPSMQFTPQRDCPSMQNTPQRDPKKSNLEIVSIVFKSS